MTPRQPTFGHGGTARFDEEVTTMVSKALASLDAWLELAAEVPNPMTDKTQWAVQTQLGVAWGS